VSCDFSKELLALYVEGDLSDARADVTATHVRQCGDCRTFLDELGASQSLLKSLRGEAVRPSDCTPMRREVMSIIEERRERMGWALRIERAIVLGAGLRSYALASPAGALAKAGAVALLAIVSVSVLAQMRQPTPGMASAVFEEGDTLLRPDGYRDWILVAPAAAATHTAGRTVYINPPAYREYEKTGRFPDGTLMVWQPVGDGPDTAPHPHKDSALLVSVKDRRRFEGGWGFFDFTGLDGTVAATAQALPESGCGTCHRQDAETDHVFTQFYPVLQSARRTTHSLHLRATRYGGQVVPRHSARVTDLLAVSHDAALGRPSRVVRS
jgi:hypothetical protein